MGGGLAVFIVESEAAATDLRLELSLYGMIAGRGGPAPATLVLVVGWLEAESLAGLALPLHVHVFDRRLPARREAAADSAALSDQEMYQRWQGSQAAARGE